MDVKKYILLCLASFFLVITTTLQTNLDRTRGRRDPDAYPSTSFNGRKIDPPGVHTINRSLAEADERVLRGNEVSIAIEGHTLVN